jgi:hypothetical protein
LCGVGEEITVTLEPREIVTLCITNDTYSVASGDVSIEFVECGCVGCEESCQQYTVWTAGTTATINYLDCNTGLPTVDTLTTNDAVNVCVRIGETVNVPIGFANVNLSSACGCCREACWTWQATNPTEGSINFSHKSCGGPTPVITVPANSTITYCAEEYTVPNDISRDLEFVVTSSCGCTL